ncbi:hypothetical protein KR100_05745 [Synechococcus sp. KORDI-100]|nr:hypothetical protein KR100_05745 [Synechococcus sp. KORDI-100]
MVILISKMICRQKTSANALRIVGECRSMAITADLKAGPEIPEDAQWKLFPVD